MKLIVGLTHRRKYGKQKKCLTMIMLICIKNTKQGFKFNL